jgi:large conductance mechanosensitive channel
VLKEFEEFIARGHVVDLAVAVIMGAAFSKIVNTLVEGVIMPPIGLLLGRVDFANLMYILDHSKGVPESLADAKTKGIPVVAYGALINDVITFLIVAFVVFLLVKIANALKNKQAGGAPTTQDCPFCLATIPAKAIRCSQCCIDLNAA